MGLTKITAKSVKDDEITTDQIAHATITSTNLANDSCTQDKIADEAVDEARLQVSNAGSNGQFLQKQSGDSGGLTWAAVPAGVGGANELQLNDSVKIKLGTDNDYEFYCDSANLILDHTADGQTTLIRSKQNGNVTFDASDTGNQVAAKFKWSNDSTPVSNAELYYGGVKKAETVTGGFTVTGACTATSFSGDGSSLTNLPPGGNTFTAVANGAIANNKAVKIDNDGKVSEIKNQNTARSDPNTRSAAVPDSNTARHVHACNCGTGMILVLWYDDVTNRAEMRVAYNADTAGSGYSWGPQQTSVLPTDYQYWFKDMAYIGNNKVVLFIRRDSNTCAAYVVSIDTSDQSITMGSGVDVTTAGEFCAVTWDPDNSKLLFAWRDTSSPYRGRLRHGTVSGTTITLAGSEVYFPRISSENEVKNIESVYDTNQNKHVIAFIYSARSKAGSWFSVDSSGTSPTTNTCSDFTSETMIDGWQEQFGMDFDSTTNRVVIAFQANSTSALRLVNGQCGSDGSMSVNGSYTTGPGVGTNHQRGIHLVFDATVGKSYLFFLEGNNTYSQCRFLTTSSSSNAISQSSSVTVRGATSNELRGRSAFFDNGIGSVLCCVRRQNLSSGIQSVEAIRVDGMDVTSTLSDGQHYMGYADQAYTNGQTATIKTVGNVAETLSGLTAGYKYYVQGDGTLGTSAGSPSCLAGVALSSSKLIIREGKSDV